MRNQLTQRSSIISGVVYVADGKLDGHSVEMYAWNQGRITLDAGPISLALSHSAATELIKHLQTALNAQEVAHG
ncbi:conserved hypothetical protein [Pseudomonas sp. 8Z]|uniref:hypothetical protein n=1 Tax=Pseudomonas sp. 8Z TaxID=2653166 RepID=UPI0012F265B1|nr:hypothetical protein [Pseudomonas sp. 8Z]VXC29972.1 conserved hypothetical protein [Pseudomonas sp. 8Z]